MSARIALRTLLFTVLVPGTVIGWAPYFWIAGPARFAAHWPPSAAEVPAVALVAFGALIYLFCAWRFATDGSGTPDPLAPPRKLVTGGLYRWTRNPMYVGVPLALIGEAWWLGSPGMAVYAAIVAVAFHLRVVMYEEPTLRRLFGSDFDAYCARVRRWGVI